MKKKLYGLLVPLFFCSFFPFLFLPIECATETRYFWNVGWTKNGLTAYAWNTTQDASGTGTQSIYKASVSGTGYFAWDIYVRSSSGSEYYQLGAKVGQVSRSSDGSGFQTQTWDCPSYQVNTTDTLVLKLYGKWDSGSWNYLYSWTSEQLGAEYVVSSTWTFYLYTQMITDPELYERWYYFLFGSSTYNSRITNFQWQAPTYIPMYFNIAENPADACFPGNTVNFTCNWTRKGSTTLSHYVFESNATGSYTNVTYAFPSGTTTYLANHTITASSTGNYVIGYKWYCNNSAGEWNSTSYSYYYVLATALPDISREEFGMSNGYSQGGTFYAGAKHAIYVTYQNTSTNPWSMCIRAYDMNESSWTEPYVLESDPLTNIGVGPAVWNDNHWMPHVSVLPNGHLIVAYGYEYNIFYKISTNNATTETNMTKLISEWSGYSNITGTLAYPTMIRWDDKLIMFYRNGTAGRGAYYFAVHNGTAFDVGYGLVIASSPYTSLYLDVYKMGNYVLCSYNGKNSTYEGDIFFMYSPDKGVTWKKVDGTTLSIPTTTDYNRIIVTGNRGRHLGCVMYENRPQVMYYYESEVYPDDIYGREIFIADYNSTIGTSGSWQILYPVDANGLRIKTGHNGAFGTFFVDPYYGLPALWTAETVSHRAAKYVQMPYDHSIFKLLFVDTSNATFRMQPQLVRDAPDCYEVISMDLQTNILGNATVGGTNVTYATGNMWGTRFTANFNATLNGVYVNAYSSSPANYWKAALYDSNLSLLAETGSCQLVSGSTGDGWLLSATFTNPPSVVAGTEYWVCYKFLASVVLRCDNVSSPVNQSLSISNAYSDSFPSSITGATYYNRTCSIFAGTQFMNVRGLGVDEFRTTFSGTGTNSSLNMTVCMFYTNVEDATGLSFAQFRWNGSGTWSNDTFTALSGTVCFVAFNFTLPSPKGTVVAWEIWVNDTAGNWGHINTQYLLVMGNFVFGVLFDSSVGIVEKLSGVFARPSSFFVNVKKEIACASSFMSFFSVNINFSLDSLQERITYAFSSLYIAVQLLTSTLQTLLTSVTLQIQNSFNLMLQTLTKMSFSFNIDISLNALKKLAMQSVSPLTIKTVLSLLACATSMLAVLAFSIQTSFSILLQTLTNITSSLNIDVAFNIIKKGVLHAIMPINVQTLLNVATRALQNIIVAANINIYSSFNLLTKLTTQTIAQLSIHSSFNLLTRSITQTIMQLNIQQALNCLTTTLEEYFVNLSLQINIAITTITHALHHVTLPFHTLIQIIIPHAATPQTTVSFALAMCLAIIAGVVAYTIAKKARSQ